ncbi:MAG: hypothetical protein ACREID_02565, partial [Planctomycetota bacterium]
FLATYLPGFLVALPLAAAPVLWLLASAQPRRWLAIVSVQLALLLVLLEACLAALHGSAKLASVPLFTDLARRLDHYGAPMIQYIPECARYDPELAYTLKPGRFVFEVTEYSTEYRVNRLGVRDDDPSLESPEIVVVGDSHAMGLGVQQEEGFPQALERMSGRKVLNTGVSSYGTARELRMLARVPMDSVRHVVVQYCANDYEENRAFRDGGLRVMAEEAYRGLVEHHARDRIYWPLKYTGCIARSLWSSVLSRIARSAPPSEDAGVAPEGGAGDEADAFLEVLRRCPADLSRARLVLVEINGYNANDTEFLDAVRRGIAAREYPEFVETMVLVDVSGALTDADYLVLDDHMRPAGHEAVARRIWDAMRGD